MKAIILKLLGAPRRAKRYVLLLADLVAVPILIFSAIALRVEGMPEINPLAYLGFAIAAAFLLWACGVYRAVIRAYDEYLLTGLISAVALFTLGVFLVASFGIIDHLPRTTAFVGGFFLFLWIWGSRAAIRSLVRFYVRQVSPIRRIAIYGAGVAGRQLLAALKPWPEHVPVLFLDDSSELIGSTIMGLRVYSGADSAQVLRRYDIKEVLLAMPSESRATRRQVIERLEPLKVHVKALPGMSQLVNGQVSISDVRDVDIADLLGRDAVPPVQELLSRDISDKVVMVSGAGGSIGSEICRQILAIKPKTLILWEVTEFALYSIEQELSRLNSDVKIVPVLGSVLHKERMLRVLKHYHVDTVYHAAAYKHVPLVEWNPFEGFVNNTLGTLRAAQAAIEANVPTFVLISTDKAVRPTNVMGATKRMAELALQAYAAEPGMKTRFCMVRFGNVLGSSGSVVPLFRQQIAKGGPITITHPDVTRYFMTIPEASQLVIQAGAMGKGGDVFVLDMGEPVRIQDLARKMVRLSGLAVREGTQGDIELEYTGLRPGEKLYEELLIGDNVTGTEHPRIMRAMENYMPVAQYVSLVDDVLTAARNDDVVKLKALLKQHVEGYIPDMNVMGLTYVPDNVVSIPAKAAVAG